MVTRERTAIATASAVSALELLVTTAPGLCMTLMALIPVKCSRTTARANSVAIRFMAWRRGERATSRAPVDPRTANTTESATSGQSHIIMPGMRIALMPR